MKTLFKILCLMMAVVMIFPLFAACNQEMPNTSGTSGSSAASGNTSSSSSSSSSSTPKDEGDGGNEQEPVDAKDAFVIFENGEYVCKFVLAANPSARDKQTFNRLATKLEQRTGKKPTSVTDAGEYDANAAEIYIGKTKYSETKDLYESLKYTEGEAKLVGNKLVLAFTNDDTANKMVESFDLALKTDASGRFFVSKSYAESVKMSTEAVTVPAYDSVDRAAIDVGNDTKMLNIDNASMADCYEYIDKLENAGFTKHSEREAGNNAFITMVKGNTYVYTYFAGNRGKLKIISGDIKYLPEDPKENIVVENTAPSLNLVGQVYNTNCGAGIIYVLPDGRLLIIDGGEKYDGLDSKGNSRPNFDKPDYMYEAIKEVAPDKDNIVIAAWYLSHPHNDHQEGFEEFIANDHHKEIKIESMVYNYATPSTYVFSNDDGSVFVNSLERICREELTDAKVIKPHTGQVICYGAVQVEIMYTIEDFLPNKIDYVNASSLVVRVEYNNTTALFLADTTHSSGSVLEAIWGNALESDMVQIAHHGLWASNKTLYDKIKASVLLFSQNTWIIKNSLINSNEHKEQINTALGYVRDVYAADYDVVVTIPLPYQYADNKAAFMTSIGK